MGIHQAFPSAQITGIDIDDQPEYPFHFLRTDAMKLKMNWIKTFDFIWASPPCQRYSTMTRINVSKGVKKFEDYPDLFFETKAILISAGKPYCIENVPNAPFDNTSAQVIELNGEMFGLKVIRRRRFELGGFWILTPEKLKLRGGVMDGTYVSVCGHGALNSGTAKKPDWAPNKTGRRTWQIAMGIDWIWNQRSLAQAVPPAYSRYIFQGFMNALKK